MERCMMQHCKTVRYRNYTEPVLGKNCKMVRCKNYTELAMRMKVLDMNCKMGCRRNYTKPMDTEVIGRNYTKDFCRLYELWHRICHTTELYTGIDMMIDTGLGMMPDMMALDRNRKMTHSTMVVHHIPDKTALEESAHKDRLMMHLLKALEGLVIKGLALEHKPALNKLVLDTPEHRLVPEHKPVPGHKSLLEHMSLPGHKLLPEYRLDHRRWQPVVQPK